MLVQNEITLQADLEIIYFQCLPILGKSTREICIHNWDKKVFFTYHVYKYLKLISSPETYDAKFLVSRLTSQKPKFRGDSLRDFRIRLRSKLLGEDSLAEIPIKACIFP